MEHRKIKFSHLVVLPLDHIKLWQRGQPALVVFWFVVCAWLSSKALQMILFCEQSVIIRLERTLPGPTFAVITFHIIKRFLKDCKEWEQRRAFLEVAVFLQMLVPSRMGWGDENLTFEELLTSIHSSLPLRWNRRTGTNLGFLLPWIVEHVTDSPFFLSWVVFLIISFHLWGCGRWRVGRRQAGERLCGVKEGKVEFR